MHFLVSDSFWWTPFIIQDFYCSCGSFLLWCIPLCDYVIIYFSMRVWLKFELFFSFGLLCSATWNVSLINILMLLYMMLIDSALIDISLFQRDLTGKTLKVVHEWSLCFISSPTVAILSLLCKLFCRWTVILHHGISLYFPNDYWSWAFVIFVYGSVYF